MDLDKRGRGRGRGGRGARGRGRGGRGRGRGKKQAAVISSDEETSLDQSFEGNSNAAIEDGEVPIGSGNAPLEIIEDIVMHDINKDIDIETANIVNNDVDISTTALVSAIEETKPITTITATTVSPPPLPPPTVQQLDMEADISQLEAPTFTTISRGPPEPMLRLKWNHKVSLIGEKVLNPMIHCCDQCEKPILVYGRMIPCKHVFCLKCARAEPIKLCLRCNDKVVRVEQSGLGTVFMCTHGGSRYGNTGCRRTYLSQRDLQAHINHRHITQLTSSIPPAALGSNIDIKPEVTLEIHKPAVNTQRKLSDATSNTTIQAPSTLLTQRPRVSSSIGTIPPPGAPTVVAASAQSTHSALTQANLARINNANAQDCHQGKVALHHTLKKTPITQSHNQPPETVADASYYSSVLNSFGSAVGGNNNTGANANAQINPNSAAAAVSYSFDSTSQPKLPSQSYQYYR